jgi:AbrB family looped-hinge helix DNA binding protein
VPKITSGGRVTIPLRIRAALGVRAGDRIDFVKTANGKFRMVPLIKGVRDREGSPPQARRQAEFAPKNSSTTRKSIVFL